MLEIAKMILKNRNFLVAIAFPNGNPDDRLKLWKKRLIRGDKLQLHAAYKYNATVYA